MVFQAKKNIKSEDLEKISDREDLSSRVHIYNGQKFLVKDSVHDDIFLEYVVSNIAHTILGNKAPEVFFVKNKSSPLKVASKFIEEYQSSKDYLSQYNHYPIG